MQFRIEHASGRAVYQQIMDQVKRDIALGKVLEGERLPTVRELAAQLAINPNTIGKAYKQLEQEGIITTRPGAGAFIANLDSQLSKAVKRKLIGEELERVVVDAYHMQVDKETLKKWFKEAAGKFKLERK
jgi:GntR family transcriptional regulator